MKAVSVILLACVAACAAEPVAGRREDAEFDEIGVGRALSHEPSAVAVSRAREDALSKAMMGASDVFYGFSDYSARSGRRAHELAAKYIFTSNQGVLTELSSGAPECAAKDAVTTCRLRVRGKIVFRGAIDPSYQILDQHSGKLLGLDRRQYYAGEPVTLSFAATKDSYLYIFSWDDEDKLSRVFPSRLAKGNRVKAGEPLILPGENSGVSYRATLPAGKTSSAERLLVVATLREIEMTQAAPVEAMIDMMRRLARLERREWTLQVVPYEIVARGENQ